LLSPKQQRRIQAITDEQQLHKLLLNSGSVCLTQRSAGAVKRSV
jgi:hypothetical protein